MISYDSLEHVHLGPKSSRIFYTSIEQEFEVKIIRTSGFPFYIEKPCMEKKLDECIDDFKDDTEKGTQILTKVAGYSAKPCKKCYQLFKISTEEDPAEFEVHLQSLFSEIEIAESKSIYDFTEKSESNRYTFYAVRN